MTRAAWGPGDLAGYTLAWLVDLQYGGHTIRMATHAVDVSSDNGTLAYEGTIADMVHARALDLFSQQAESEGIVVEGYTAIDVPTLQSHGHRLEGRAVQVSQVRLDRDLRAVDAWEDRRVVLTGVVREGQWGAYGDYDGTGGQGCMLRFRAERAWWRSGARVPRRTQRVDRDTWPCDGRIGQMDRGVAYPVVLGYPGYDPLDQDGGFPAYRGAWIRKVKTPDGHVLAVGMGQMDATTAILSTDDEIYGSSVVVDTTYTLDSAVIDCRDKRGQILTVVDYAAYGYDDSGDADYLGTSFAPSVTETGDVFVWLTPTTGGGMLVGGEMLRGAGDVLEWCLLQSGIAYDAGKVATAKPYLNRFKIDYALTEATPIAEWLTAELLPLLPVSMTEGEAGAYPVVWRQDYTEADCVAVLDADADPTIEMADHGEESSEDVVTSWALEYGYNARTDKLRYIRRIGPEFIASTDTATAEIRNDPTVGNTWLQIPVYATEEGAGGVGITITVATAAAPSVAVETTSTRTVAVTLNTADDTATAVPLLNASAGLTLVRFEAGTDSGLLWTTTSTPTLTLQITDFGTSPHPTCARGWAQIREGRLDATEEEPQTISTALVYDHSTAIAILDWHGRAFGAPQRRVSMEADEAGYAHLDLGDPVLVTDASLGISEEIGVVEGLDHYSNGRIGLRVVFID